MRTALSILIALCVLAHAAEARTSRTSSTKKTTTKSSAKKSTGAKVTKSTTSKKSGSSRRKTSSRSARSRKPAGPPRQMSPTPERYMEIQQALADKGFYTGAIDGSWTPECVQALKRFQEAQNLPVDGKLGSLSLIALGLGPKREPFHAQQLITKPEGTAEGTDQTAQP